jgi:preprotein translocase subunit Sss1
MARLFMYIFTKLHNLQQGLIIKCGTMKDVRKEFDAVIVIIATIIVIAIVGFLVSIVVVPIIVIL